MKYKNVYVGVTTLTGYIDAGCTSALVCNLQNLNAVCGTRMEFIAGSCYIQDARNRHAKGFMESECDCLIFVDSDLWFSPDAMFKLVKSEKDICAGAYPRKRGGGWPLTILVDDNGIAITEKVTGLIKARMLPTGLMMISRRVFEVIREKHPEWMDERGIFNYFQTGLHFNDKKWHGEDPFFCKIAGDLGFEIWCEPRIQFMHYGINFVTGCYHDYLLSLNPNQTMVEAEVVKEKT